MLNHSMNCFQVYDGAKELAESLKGEGQDRLGDQLLESISGTTSGEALTNIGAALHEIAGQSGIPAPILDRVRRLERIVDGLLRPGSR